MSLVAVAFFFLMPTEAIGESAGEKLVRAYPNALSHVENGDLIWRDGTRMKMSDGNTSKTPEQAIEDPDIEDMLAVPYPRGHLATSPSGDPGRARFSAFFHKMYGDCSKGGVAKHLTTIAWLPQFGGGSVRVTRINGVDQKLAAVSRDLAELPATMIKAYLTPLSGGFSCRPIAGTKRPSAHGFGIAIDIPTRNSDYWRWSQGAAYRNRIPVEIVEIFERHGFIWGGKWRSFDTMHFEYRPELLLD